MIDEGLNKKIEMTRSQALSWVKLAIEKRQYDNAIHILESLIKQEEEHEKNDTLEGGDRSKE